MFFLLEIDSISLTIVPELITLTLPLILDWILVFFLLLHHLLVPQIHHPFLFLFLIILVSIIMFFLLLHHPLFLKFIILVSIIMFVLLLHHLLLPQIHHPFLFLFLIILVSIIMFFLLLHHPLFPQIHHPFLFLFLIILVSIIMFFLLLHHPFIPQIHHFSSSLSHPHSAQNTTAPASHFDDFQIRYLCPVESNLSVESVQNSLSNASIGIKDCFIEQTIPQLQFQRRFKFVHNNPS